jgi:hypothetical protein
MLQVLVRSALSSCGCRAGPRAVNGMTSSGTRQAGRIRGTTCLYSRRPLCWAAEGPGAGKGARLALVERLGAAANVYEFAQQTTQQFAPTRLRLHSFINTPSRRRDEARGIYANGAPEVGGQAPEQIVPTRWNRTASLAARLSSQTHVSPLPGTSVLCSLLAALESSV